MSNPSDRPQPGDPVSKIIASEIQRNTKKLLDALDDYLDYAAENGPGRASGPLSGDRWAALRDAVVEAAYSTPQGLRRTHLDLVTAIARYEQGGKLLRALRLNDLYRVQDIYRLTADIEIAKLRGKTV